MLGACASGLNALRERVIFTFWPLTVSNSAKWSHTSATPQSGWSLFSSTAFSKRSEILMTPHRAKDLLADLTLHSYGLVLPVS